MIYLAIPLAVLLVGLAGFAHGGNIEADTNKDSTRSVIRQHSKRATFRSLAKVRERRAARSLGAGVDMDSDSSSSSSSDSSKESTRFYIEVPSRY